MEHLPNDWISLMLLVSVLGARHGMDVDHLATIDGLTRFNALSHPSVSKWCGVLFSLGHGAVVTAISVAVGLLAGDWNVPSGLAELGSAISVLCLLLLGGLNLATLFTTPADQVILPIGMKGRWLVGFGRSSHPALIALVGALFALSFDTVSQAVVFSVAAASMAGWGFSALLGVVFMSGMMVTDGINGLWISRILARADRRARIASRVMGLAISGSSLAVGGFGLIKLCSPGASHSSANNELTVAVTLTAFLALCFLLALRLAGRDRKMPALAPEGS